VACIVQLTNEQAIALEIFVTSAGNVVTVDDFIRLLGEKTSPLAKDNVHRLVSNLRRRLEKDYLPADRSFINHLFRPAGRHSWVFTQGQTRVTPEETDLSDDVRTLIWKRFVGQTCIIFTNQKMWLKLNPPYNLTLSKQGRRQEIDSYSGHGEVFSTFELARVFYNLRQDPLLKRATEGDERLLKQGNVVWLGSPLGSDVLQKILTMNLWQRKWGCSFRVNARPYPGEAVIRCQGRRTPFRARLWGIGKKQYGWLALSKIRDYDHYFLLLAGTDTWATRSCTDLVTSTDRSNQNWLGKIARTHSNSDGTFEVLVEMTKGQDVAVVQDIVWSSKYPSGSIPES
jgi:hypothetical protein